MRLCTCQSDRASRNGLDYVEHRGAMGNAASAEPASILEADGETRTPDPIITSDVLYQLSYVGEGGILPGLRLLLGLREARSGGSVLLLTPLPLL
jgi:hypothetical protein